MVAVAQDLFCITRFTEAFLWLFSQPPYRWWTLNNVGEGTLILAWHIVSPWFTSLAGKNTFRCGFDKRSNDSHVSYVQYIHNIYTFSSPKRQCGVGMGCVWVWSQNWIVSLNYKYQILGRSTQTLKLFLSSGRCFRDMGPFDLEGEGKARALDVPIEKAWCCKWGYQPSDVHGEI